MIADFFWLILDNLFRGLGEIVSATVSGALCPQIGSGQVPPYNLGCFAVQVLYQPFVEAFIRPIFVPWGTTRGFF